MELPAYTSHWRRASFQDECINLLDELLKENYEVALETGGSLPIYDVPKEVIKIIDFFVCKRTTI